MSIATISKPTYATVAALVKHLGVPAKRIRLVPTPGTAKEKDAIHAEARCGRLCELIDGVLVEKAMGFWESYLAIRIIGFLQPFVSKNDLGIVLGADGMVSGRRGQVRMPDVCFFSWHRFPDRILPLGAVLRMTPDLAIEVLSPSNTKKEMTRKRRENFAGGAKLVWEVDPKKKLVHVYTSAEESTVFKVGDSIAGGDVLPGFKLAVRDIFDKSPGA